MNKETLSNKWHLDPKISIGHILSTIMIVATLFVYIHKMDTRLAVTEARLAIAEKQLDKNKRELSTQVHVLSSSITNRLNRIANKLDELIMRKSK